MDGREKREREREIKQPPGGSCHAKPSPRALPELIVSCSSVRRPGHPLRYPLWLRALQFHTATKRIGAGAQRLATRASLRYLDSHGENRRIMARVGVKRLEKSHGNSIVHARMHAGADCGEEVVGEAISRVSSRGARKTIMDMYKATRHRRAG